MMNKNYIKGLINEMFDQNILNSEDDRQKMKEMIAEFEEDFLTGDFDEDLESLTRIWENEVEAEETDEPVVEEEDEPVDETQDIEDIVDSLKVGFNYVPGIGVGYCSNKEDLEAMKNFVRGGIAIRNMIGEMFGF